MISAIIPKAESYEIEKQIQDENDGGEISLNSRVIEENKGTGKK